jgi:putative ABC transport system permease protein
MFLAGRNLFQNKTRLVLSVAGVALAIMLILILTGFRDGLYRRLAAYLDHAPGSVIVAQAGVNNFLAASSLLPPGTIEAARQVPGVASVTPLISQIAIYDDRGGTKRSAYLVGYDPALGGGPWRLVDGREPQADDEVVMDRVNADQQGVALGDTLTIMGRQFTVVGRSAETMTWTGGYLFARRSALAGLLLAPDAASHLLVSPAPGVAPETVRDRLRELPGTTALLKRDVIANDRALFARIFDPPLRLMVAIALLVGTLVVGLVIYTATVERQREYGVLKALGARNGLLYRAVTAQALVASGAGAVVGVALAVAVGRLIMGVRPQFLVSLEPAAVGGALLAGLVMALLAALGPARTIAHLAPADVFRR